jgi:CheY-like chemotaxis protein
MAADTAGPGPRAEPSPARAAAAQSLRVLVVDDNVEVAQTIGWMLEEIGHQYRLIHDGREALEAARDFRPDAILLDIGLPVMDGYAVCRAFRQDELFKDTLIIAQTGWGQQRDKNLASEARFDRHLVKPVGYDDLERILAEMART